MLSARWWLAGLVLAMCFSPARAEEAIGRISADRMAAVRKAVERLKTERKEVESLSGLGDYRANLHVHSSLSHDSRGKIEEIVAAAKKIGTKVLLFSEHPAPHYDFVTDGHQGLKDGVLLIPGAETKGLLVYPKQSLKTLEAGGAQELSDLVRGRGGLTFLSHLEERMEADYRGLTGSEIYNTHAVVKANRRLAASLRDPFWLVSAAGLFKQYPQEAFSALHEYPADYLKRYDELCTRRPLTAIAANDAHQSLGVSIRLIEGNVARVETALGEKIVDLNADLLAVVQAIPKNAKTGDTVFQLQLDPYENSLRHVCTHLKMNELTADAVWQALEAGRTYVSFDWIADPTGFDFVAEAAGKRHPLGSRVVITEGMKLLGRAPLSGHWKLFRSGKMVAEAEGREFSFDVSEAGVYRAELWLEVAGEKQVWVLSGPIYVSGK